MRARFTCPLKTNVYLTEHWPIRIDQDFIEWKLKDGHLKAISITIPLGENDHPPQFHVAEGNDKTKQVSYKLSRISEVQQMLRTLQGLVSLHCRCDIQFGGTKIEWLADTDEEKPVLNITLSHQPKSPPDPYKPQFFEYETIAKAMASVRAAKHYEIPLSFLRKGRQDIDDGRFIEGYYNYFFFLETLFAPGYSNPKTVAKKFQDSPEIISAIAQIRSEPDLEPGYVDDFMIENASKLRLHLQKSDKEIIDHLIKTRGKLHHHSMKHEHAWHPDESDKFIIEAYLLQDIANAVAWQIVNPIMHKPEQGHTLMRSAEEANAITQIFVRSEEGFEQKKTVERVLKIRAPGRKVNRDMVYKADLEYRRITHANTPHVHINGYKVTAADESDIYATYKRHSPLHKS